MCDLCDFNTTYVKRGECFTRKAGLLALLADDALAGLDCDKPEVSRIRLESLLFLLRDVHGGDVFPAAPQSDFLKVITGRCKS